MKTKQTIARPAPRIVVVGGGFAGVQAAKTALRRMRAAHLTLIDPTGLATMIPALPDVLSGRISREKMARPHAEILDPGRVTLIRDYAESVDLATRTVHLRGGSCVYDALVIAAGSRPEFFGFEPDGATLHGVDTLERARAFRAAIAEGAPTRPVVIVGGGYTGLETALSLRAGEASVERRPIIVVDAADALLTFLSEKQRTTVIQTLDEANIEIRTGTTLTTATADEAVLSDGTRIEGALICWAAGMRSSAPPLDTGDGSSVETTRDGRIVVQPDLSVPQFPNVFVAGDSAALMSDGALVRRAVNFAYYSGRRAGANAAANLRGRDTRAFSPVDLGWVIPLGTTSVGKAFGWMPLGGRMGLRMHYAMCGFRHFGGGEARHFYASALALRRRPDALPAADALPTADALPAADAADATDADSSAPDGAP